ncbi:unnamed protein product [Effrenium voratum]|uniref:Apple domain-containing protein n=1 Tax=Effrenium voratum TaxID=2562239 RepID=A0AA36J8F4_9DINO|nr:unnamed protein product [Effrenium voratum]
MRLFTAKGSASSLPQPFPAESGVFILSERYSISRMKQVNVFLFLAASTIVEAAKVHTLDSAIRSIYVGAGGQSEVSYRPSEEDIQYVLSHAREGGDGLSRIEVSRIRAKDPVTGEEFDDVFVNESFAEGRSICQDESENFTPSVAVLETARRLRDSEHGLLLAAAVSAYVDLAEYFGQEIYHMEAPVGSEEPMAEPQKTLVERLSQDWSEQLNAVLAGSGRTPCPNTAEWLLFCMKKTTCLLERAAEGDPHGITPGRMATYLEVAKEVEDHFEEFAIQAQMGLPHMPDLCEGEEQSTEMPAVLMQLKAESGAGQRLGRAVGAVVHTLRASQRTAQALEDHSRLHLLESSFFTHTWKKACELIGCKTSSFVDIMDASAGHTAELVDVNASWHAVKTHHVAFMQFRTSVWKAMNASNAFHENFTSFIYEPGRAHGAKRTDPIYKEAGDVLSTALALRRNNDNGKGIKRSGWWCFSWRASATGAYGKKFPKPESVWGVVAGFKMITGSTASLTYLMSGKKPTVDLKTSVGLTIGYVPQLSSVAGVRAGVSVGGTVALGADSFKMSISLGLGMSAATGLVHHSFCGGPQSIPTPIGDIKCGGSVAASFTLFCKSFDFLSGDNSASMDDPCATGSKVHVQNHRRRRRWHYDMPGQSRTVEAKAEYCRERCNKVSGCAHYSYWKNGGCHLQNWDSHTEKKNDAKTGSPICCAMGQTRFEYEGGHRRRRNLDMPGRERSTEDVMEKCQQRCQRVNGCHHFTYWTNGGCHLSGAGAVAKPDSSRRRPTVAGKPHCDES